MGSFRGIQGARHASRPLVADPRAYAIWEVVGAAAEDHTHESWPAERSSQAAQGGLKAPIWAMMAATSSAAHSSLILPPATR